MTVPAVTDSHRLINIFHYPPLKPGIRPEFPQGLIEMFLHELSMEPHHNPFSCDRCGREYLVAPREGVVACKQESTGRGRCTGTIIRRWTFEKARVELARLMAEGRLTIAWENSEHPKPVALAVCEQHRARSVMHAIDFQPTTLSTIYSTLGREEPLLVLSHLWVDGVAITQRGLLVHQMLNTAIESAMKAANLVTANLLIPVSRRRDDSRAGFYKEYFGGRQHVLEVDPRTQLDRQRALWGAKIRLSND